MEVALLHDLVSWREALARSIARNNLELKSDQITAAVNRILFPLLLLRVAEDRHMLPHETLAGLRNFRTVSQLISDLAPYADALYADEPAYARPHQDPGNDFVVEDTVIRSVLEALLSPERRFNCGKMTTIAISMILMQYLARTIRRSAAHQATVVDTHDTVVSGGSVAPPLPLTEYMVKTALSSARKNRSPREIIPLRLFDPACSAGTVLLAAYRHLLDEAGGAALTFDERREILTHSVYGLDLSRHAVAATRMLLVLELCDSCDNGRVSEIFSGTFHSVLRDLRHTILCGNALVGPAIVEDESWMFCPARDRHKLNPFSHEDRLPEIAASGGFDAVVCNPPEGQLEQREWIQQYFQRWYAVYHPRIDRSAYFIEKSLSLVYPGGVVACVMSARWLRGSTGTSLREMLGSRQVEEVVDLSPLPAGKPGTGYCILRVLALPPGRPMLAVPAGVTFLDNPDAFVAAHSFPVDQHLLDAGGWALRDTRADEILRKVNRHSTPLEDVVMGQIYAGIRIAEDDPFVIDEALAREWIRRDPRCKHLLRPIIAGNGIGRYLAGAGGKFILLIPQGWTLSHPNAGKKPWQWLKRRHPQIARHLQPFSEQLMERTGPDGVWWESACDEFWQERRKKIIVPAHFEMPAFWFDTGRGIGDEATIAISSAGLYLAGILNSRLMAFVFDSAVRQAAPGRKLFSWDDLAQLPVYTPDLDRPEDRARYERMEKLVHRMLDLVKHGRSAQSDLERKAVQKKIRATDRLIDMLVYEIYELIPEKIAVVEANSPK